MPIDTDDLTDKTYKAIMVEAERFNHDLTLQFGLLSYDCEDEKDFIKKSKQLIIGMMKYNKDDLEQIFFGSPPGRNEFHKALKKIMDNISRLNYGN